MHLEDNLPDRDFQRAIAPMAQAIEPATVPSLTGDRRRPRSMGRRPSPTGIKDSLIALTESQATLDACQKRSTWTQDTWTSPRL